MTARDELIQYLAMNAATASFAGDMYGLGVTDTDRREAAEMVDAAISEALRAAAEKQRAAIASLDLDDHWAVFYRAEDVEKLPDLIDPPEEP